MTTDTHWADDRDELTAFIEWFLEGSGETWRLALDIVEKPWHWDEDYEGFVFDRKVLEIERNARAIQTGGDYA